MALLLFAGGAFGACSGEAPPPPKFVETPVPVALATAVPAGGESSLVVSGTVRLKRETPLGFNTPGRIAAINVREGDAVGKGQVLAQLDPTGLDAASSSARAEAARANADLYRLEILYKKGWVPAARVETARAAAVAARARADQAGFEVGLATIRAPAAGLILRRPGEPGQIVQPGQTVLVLGEASSGYVLRVPLADVDLTRVQLGQLATVTLPALGPEPLAAWVSEIGARGDDATGTFRVELALSPRAGLRSGLIGSALLRFSSEAPAGGAVTVPATAVFSARADEGFVYVYVAVSGRVKLRQVSLGLLDDNGLTITAGLAPGEKVVTSGPDRLRDGREVKVRSTALGG